MGFETLGKKLAQLGADTKTSVKKMSENYQMGSKITDEKKNLEKLLAQIGAAAFEKFEDNPPEGLEDIFDAVKAAKATIADLEDQKQKLSGMVVCPECGKEAAKGEKFCSACGTKLPDEPVDEMKDRMKQDVKEAASEAGAIMNEAADKAKDLFSTFAEKADAFVKGVSSKLNEKETDEETETSAEEAECDAETVAEAECDAEAAAEECAESEEVLCEAAEAAEETEEVVCEAEEAVDAMDEEVKKVQEAAQENAE